MSIKKMIVVDQLDNKNMRVDQENIARSAPYHCVVMEVVQESGEVRRMGTVAELVLEENLAAQAARDYLRAWIRVVSKSARTMIGLVFVKVRD